MEQTDCTFEAEVARAAKSGIWSDDLKQHLVTCEFCRGSASVSEALHQLSVETALPASLPNARLIWMKAQVIKKQRYAAKLEWYSRLGLAACILIGVISMLSWKSPYFGSLLGLTSSSTTHSWLDLVTATLPFTATAAFMMIMKLFTPDSGRRRRIL